MARDVLIVDDSATMRQMVKKTISLASLDVGRVFEASDGVEALEQLDEHKVAVVILNINMLTMNGIQLLTHMKQNTRLKDIPVVIASSEGSQERMAQLQKLGACGYVRKPFIPEQLRDVLEPLLGVRYNYAAEECDTQGDFF